LALPTLGGNPLTLHDSQPFFIRCPECGQTSDSIKSYRMPDLLVFAWFFYWVRSVTYYLCPSCMRKTIGGKMLINIVTANLVWPFLAIFWLVLLVLTFFKGHSKGTLKQIGFSR
jgi:hypothetical protein